MADESSYCALVTEVLAAVATTDGLTAPRKEEFRKHRSALHSCYLKQVLHNSLYCLQEILEAAE